MAGEAELLAIFKSLFGDYGLIYLTIFGFILLFSRFMIKEYKPNVWKNFSYLDKLTLSLIVGVISLLGVSIFIPFILLAQGNFSFDNLQINESNINNSAIMFLTFFYGLVFLFIRFDSRKPTDIIKKYFSLTFLLFFMSIILSGIILSVIQRFGGTLNFFSFIILCAFLLGFYSSLTKTVFEAFGIRLPLYEKLSNLHFRRGAKK